MGIDTADAQGRRVPNAKLPLHLKLDGPAVLAGFGSGNPVTEDNYFSGLCHAYHGRAMVVVHGSGETGEITLTVTVPERPEMQAAAVLQVV